jgi:uncharacterized tellurite resistance protein B-like protein
MTDLQKRLISFQNLLVVAASDGSLGEDEKEVLIEIGADMGLTPEDLKPIISTQNATFVLHDNLEDNKADLGDMLTIAAADGVVYESEYDVCKAFAAAAGISESEMKEMLEYAMEYEDDEEEEA